MQFSKRKTCQVSVFHMLIIFARVGERRKGLKMDWQKIGKNVKNGKISMHWIYIFVNIYWNPKKIHTQICTFMHFK